MKGSMLVIVGALCACLLFGGLSSLAQAQGATGAIGATQSTAESPDVTQDFQDVPVSSTFYSFIHNIYADGIVGGYRCGVAPAGPCVRPGNLPYYLPGNNVTRQQMAAFL